MLWVYFFKFISWFAISTTLIEAEPTPTCLNYWFIIQMCLFDSFISHMVFIALTAMDDVVCLYFSVDFTFLLSFYSNKKPNRLNERQSVVAVCSFTPLPSFCQFNGITNSHFYEEAPIFNWCDDIYLAVCVASLPRMSTFFLVLSVFHLLQRNIREMWKKAHQFTKRL